MDFLNYLEPVFILFLLPIVTMPLIIAVILTIIFCIQNLLKKGRK